MKLVFIASLLSSFAAAEPGNDLVRKYMQLGKDFTYLNGKIIGGQSAGANKLGNNSFQVGAKSWIKLSDIKMDDGVKVWRLSEIERDARGLGRAIASTSTFYNNSLRSVTKCVGSRNSDGSESGRLSCATASRQVCQYVNDFFRSKYGKGNDEVAHSERLNLALVKEGAEALGGMDQLGPVCSAFSSYMAAANKAVALSVSSKEGRWKEMVEADHKAIQEQLDASGRFPKRLGFSSVSLVGANLDDFGKRSVSLDEAAQDMLAAANQLELCQQAANDFPKPDQKPSGIETSRPQPASK